MCRQPDLHAEIRDRIRSRMACRSLRQLAIAAEIPYSTLHQQMSEERFSLDVLWSLAAVLEIDAIDLIPRGPHEI